MQAYPALHIDVQYELLLGPNKCIRGGGALKRLLVEREAAAHSAVHWSKCRRVKRVQVLACPFHDMYESTRY
jgi:hypothetical protein